MSITHLAGCASEHDARIKALAYQNLSYRTVIIGPADTLQLEPVTGAVTSQQGFGAWAVVATKGTIEAVTLPAGG